MADRWSRGPGGQEPAVKPHEGSLGSRRRRRHDHFSRQLRIAGRLAVRRRSSCSDPSSQASCRCRSWRSSMPRTADVPESRPARTDWSRSGPRAARSARSGDRGPASRPVVTSRNGRNQTGGSVAVKRSTGRPASAGPAHASCKARDGTWCTENNSPWPSPGRPVRLVSVGVTAGR